MAKNNNNSKLRIVAKPIHSKLILSITKLKDSRLMIEQYIKEKGVDSLRRDPYITMLLKDARTEVEQIITKLS